MKTGKISRVLESYGFIRGDDGKDYFFLPMVVKVTTFSDLKRDQRVLFDTKMHTREVDGQAVETERAINVTPLEE